MAVFQTTNIKTPGPHDILCGRGGGTNAHPGNIKFRKLAAARKLRYLAASTRDKPGVARDVVREWRALDPPGRFLARGADPAAGGDSDGDGDGGSGAWHDIGDQKAREKVSQCLRERSGAANEAVSALVKTVKASGEACPEDYATLMNLAAQVRERNEQTIRRQGELIQKWQRWLNGCATGAGVGAGLAPGAAGPVDREQFEPISLQQPQDGCSSPLGDNGIIGGGNFGGPCEPTENNVSGADIQMLQRLLDPQQPTDEDGVRREYDSLAQKELEVSGQAGKTMGQMGAAAASEDARNNAPFNSGGMNVMLCGPAMGGSANNANHGDPVAMVASHVSHNAAGNYMSRLRMMQRGGRDGGEFGGNGVGGNVNSMPDQVAAGMSNMGNHSNAMGVGGGNDAAMSNNVGMSQMQETVNVGNNSSSAAMIYNSLQLMLNVGNMGDNAETMAGVGGITTTMGSNNGNSIRQQQVQGGNSGAHTPEEFSNEEYQASLREFLSYRNDISGNGGAGGNSDQVADADPQLLSRGPAETQNAVNWGPAWRCIEITPKPRDGPRKSRRASDDMDLPPRRDTIQSMNSLARRSFQSLDDLRGTFHSIDTIDLLSIENSTSKGVDANLKQPSGLRKKYARRLSNLTVLSRYGTQPETMEGDGGNEYNGPEGRTVAKVTGVPGQTFEVKTKDHGPKKAKKEQGGEEGGKGVVDNQAKGIMRQTTQIKDNNGLPFRRRSSILSIKDLNLDLDDGRRMSFGAMSGMSDMSDFLELMQSSKGIEDSTGVYESPPGSIQLSI